MPQCLSSLKKKYAGIFQNYIYAYFFPGCRYALPGLCAHWVLFASSSASSQPALGMMCNSTLPFISIASMNF